MSAHQKNPIRVIVIDDHPLVCDGISFIVGHQDDLEVAGVADNGPEGLELCKREKPDLILLDLQMPEFGGIEFLQAFQNQELSGEVLILTTYSREEDIYQVIHGGARGYILKDSTREVIVEAIREVAAGREYFQAEVIRKFEAQPEGNRFTEREREVLNLVATGLLNKQVGDRLGIAERTVKIHLSNVFRKMRVSTRGEAISVAHERGLLSAPRSDSH